MGSKINFLLCLAGAIFLTYAITGTGGIFVTILLITALVFSLTIKIITSKTLSISVELSTEVINKGENFEAKVLIGKGTILPTCFVDFELGFTENISSEEVPKYRVISAKRSGDVINIPLKAELSGGGSVYLKSVTLADFLGISKKKIPVGDEVRRVSILPRIPDTGTQAEIMKTVSESITFEDSDEESDETALGSTGVPGYDHRQYVEGDPLKKINWKMSSKRNILMVRLDEKITSSSQVFQLDYPEKENADREYYENADLIIEASLAMLNMMIRQGYESEYSFYLDGWQTVDVKDYKSITYLQEQLGKIRPYPLSFRFPDININQKNRPLVCFTTCDRKMTGEINELAENVSGMFVVTKYSGIMGFSNNIWTVNKEFEFEKTQNGGV